MKVKLFLFSRFPLEFTLAQAGAGMTIKKVCSNSECSIGGGKEAITRRGGDTLSYDPVNHLLRWFFYFTLRNMPSFLNQIIEQKKQELEQLQRLKSLEVLKKEATGLNRSIRDFKASIKQKDRLALIAEIKKASSSAGLLRPNFEPVRIAQEYEVSGKVDALSVLTESQFFQGSPNFISDIRLKVSLPILRKDFLLEPYHIYESYLFGADAILLIVKILTPEKLHAMLSLSHSLGLGCLVEVHSREELEMALGAGAEIIGINARDLETFQMNPNLFEELAPFIPDNKVKVAESGLENREDLRRVKKAGTDAVLMGTIFMKAENISEKLKELFDPSL